jgi:hypothetical protein
MNCDDVCRILAEAPVSSPLPDPVLRHLKECPRCQDAARALDPARLEDAPSSAQLRQIEQALLASLRPVRPLPPAGYFFACLAAIFVAVVVAGVWWLGTAGLAAMSPLQSTVILSVLTVSAAALAYALVQQMAPGSSGIVKPGPLPIAMIAVLTAGIALLFSFQSEKNFWSGAWGCILPGLIIAAVAAVPLWLVLRRGAILSPAWMGAATGLLAGLAGATALEIRCPNLDAWHILAGHLGAAILSATAGFLIALPLSSTYGHPRGARPAGVLD